MICKKCGVNIRVLSTRKDGTYLYSPLLSACPQCGSNNIKELSREKYDNLDVSGIGGLWILVKKKYGRKTIKFSLKFEGLINEME